MYKAVCDERSRWPKMWSHGNCPKTATQAIGNRFGCNFGQSAYGLICFSPTTSMVRSTNGSHRSFGRWRLIDTVSALCTSLKAGETSRQPMWAVLRERFIFIAIGHPPFVAASSTAFYMFCASNIIEIIEVASGEWLRSIHRRRQRQSLGLYFWAQNETILTVQTMMDLVNESKSIRWTIRWNRSINFAIHLFAAYQTNELILTFAARHSAPL